MFTVGKRVRRDDRRIADPSPPFSPGLGLLYLIHLAPILNIFTYQGCHGMGSISVDA
ncbi:hypothetical protein BT93_A2009 [Corymbia citriodora subsp. variegata]|nr:hypothetical protein BT93_A2009 [Corymbia citriodora subsp. variegata]